MMGVVPGAAFPAKSCRVPPGARLLIFSDGIFEIRRDQRAAWDLPSCISHLTSLSPRAETLMDELLAQAKERRGSHQLDDDFSIIEARLG
jgi:serine phosphatase RsbU (regulator of sigma subunit)